MKRKIYKLLVALGGLLISSIAFAADGGNGVDGLIAIGSGLAIGLAALGGTTAQGRAAGAAFEGIARNPESSGKVMVTMIIGLALIESLCIYALVIAFMVLGNVPGTDQLMGLIGSH